MRLALFQFAVRYRAFALLLLCAGCAGTFARNRGSCSCAVPVDECDSGECATCSNEGPCSEFNCSRIWGPVHRYVEPIVCRPYKAVCYLVNFCTPDGFCGPPDVPGPGRFQPVPTHPVFEPAGPPMTYPTPSAQ